MICRERVPSSRGTYVARVSRLGTDESGNRENLNHLDDNMTTKAPDIYSLERHGIPREVLEALVFEHGGDSSLLELQRKGIEIGLCDREKLLNVSGIISGPTSSGKTLLAELRMLIRYFDEKRSVEGGLERSLGRGKTIFLVPMKAIGLEKLRYFRGVYGRFGIQVRYSDGDVRTDDGDILRGKYDVAIMVNEKLKFFEQHNPHLLKNVGEVVVDELGMISDRQRGPQLEMTITALLLSPHKPVVLALTTPLEGIERLAALLGGFLLQTGERPINIRAGVWIAPKGEFQSWSCNTLEMYPPERLHLGYPSDKDKTLKELLLRYKKGVMFAVPSKALAIGYASRLSRLIDRDTELRKLVTGPIHSSLAIEDRLGALEPTRNQEALAEYLKQGIGFHHADLTPEERKEVEDAFRNGEISVVFCTSTLARGINLPAEAIIFLDWGDTVPSGEHNAGYYGQLRNEFMSWVGRVGRFDGPRLAQPVAVYLAQTYPEANRIRRLIFTRRAPLSTHLADADIDLTSHILYAAASLSNAALAEAKLSQQRSATAYPFTLQDLRKFFSHTVTGTNNDLKSLLLNRVTNCLLSLVNKDASQSFVSLRELLDRLLRVGVQGQSVQMHGKDIPGLVYSLRRLAHLGMAGDHAGRELIAELSSALKKSLGGQLRSSTLPELARLFRRESIHKDIGRMIAMLKGIDPGYLSRGLGELGELLEKDGRLGSLPGLKRTKDTLDAYLTSLVEHELENMCDVASTWLNRVKACQLARQPFVDLRGAMETDESMQALLRYLTGEASANEASPTYLRWVEAGGKQGFELTTLGKICCSYGISTATCDELYTWTKSGARGKPVREAHVLELFRVLLHTFDGRLINPLKTELASSTVELLSGKQGALGSPPFINERKDIIVTCLAMADWIKGMPTIDIERKYNLRCGSLYEVARQLSRLTRALRDIAKKALGGQVAETQAAMETTRANGTLRIPHDLADLAEMVLYGLPSEALPVARLRVEGLTRGWIMRLLHGLHEQGISDDLPVIERLQVLTDEQLKGMLPTRGLIRRVREALSEYGKAPLAANLVSDRRLALRYYLLPQVIKAQLERGKPHYGQQARNMAVRIITRDRRHTMLRRNDPNTSQPIKITSEQDFLSWVKRGGIDFYGEISEVVAVAEGAETGERGSRNYVTDRFLVDLDPWNGFPMDRLEAVTQRVYELFEQLPQVAEAKIYWTGGKGFYVVGFFKEGIRLDIQVAKQKLTALLNVWRISNDVDIFMEQDPTNLEPYLTIDLSPLMPRGLYRNELSIHAVSGGCCVEVGIDHLKDFDPDLEATPEAVAHRLIAELTDEEKNAYLERVTEEMETVAEADNA
jgi:superfamily II DNA/RNA helicase